MQKPQSKATGGRQSTSSGTEACTPVPITACASDVSVCLLEDR